MLKGGAKVAPPKTGASLSNSSSATIRTSRSSGSIASDLRLTRLKRASSDEALAKPALGPAASVSRLKKTVTTGAISELAENRPRSLSEGLRV